MSPDVKKLVVQAVVQYLNGDIELFRKWTAQAYKEYRKRQYEDRLHASVAEILKAKGVNVSATILRGRRGRKPWQSNMQMPHSMNQN
ncbi:MAG: hypothetical protein K0R80_141 [Clostridia bacterium]|jgi:hypothetical protein|nr:hypothetical protein [Clostridia bacterium]